MRVTLSDDALADLQAIGDEIAKHNPIRAATYVDELIVACLSLDENSERCALTLQFGKGVRRLLFGEYCVFHRVRDETVQVSRIPHGRRQIRRSMIP